jgi:hypothetical protein
MVIMVVTALTAAACILWMQGRYEAADEKNALEIVQDYRPRGGSSIPEVLAARHPGRPPSWSTAVKSSCFQHILVVATIEEAEPKAYAFVVDINAPAIHPGNPLGQEVLEALDAPRAPPSTTAASASR